MATFLEATMKIQQRERESNQPSTSYSKENYRHLTSFIECDSYLRATWSKKFINIQAQTNRNAMVSTELWNAERKQTKGTQHNKLLIRESAQYSSYLCHINGLVQINEYKEYQFDFPALPIQFQHWGVTYKNIYCRKIGSVLWDMNYFYF